MPTGNKETATVKKLGTALRLIALATLIPAALMAGGESPQPDQEQMTCSQYCRTVCAANGEPCCFLGPNTCGCC